MNDVSSIVVGAGAIGSAAAYWLARRGQNDVLVLERFELGHARGASDDHSRVIRHSYHSNAYGRLTRQAYENWADLETESAQKVLIPTGGLDIAIEGTDGVSSVLGYRNVLEENGHPFEVLDRDGLVERFPQWHLDRPVVATYQPDSGILDIRRARQTHTALAEARGAVFVENRPVRRLESIPDGVRVHTDEGAVTADHVVVATASWTDELLKPLGQSWSTTISQEQVAYFAPSRLRDFAIGTFPLWVWHGENMFYGFPVYGEVGIKIARDVTGRVVTHESRTFEPIREETDLLAGFLREHLPSGAGREVTSKTCIYDMAPDRDFVLDRMPGHPRIVLGLGGGHAAKFAGLFGEIIAELVVDGRSRQPIEAFAATRTALTDPSFVPTFALRG